LERINRKVDPFFLALPAARAIRCKSSLLCRCGLSAAIANAVSTIQEIALSILDLAVLDLGFLLIFCGFPATAQFIFSFRKHSPIPQRRYIPKKPPIRENPLFWYF